MIDCTVNVWRKSRSTIDFGSSWRKVGVLLNDNSDELHVNNFVYRKKRRTKSHLVLVCTCLVESLCHLYRKFFLLCHPSVSIWLFQALKKGLTLQPSNHKLWNSLGVVAASRGNDCRVWLEKIKLTDEILHAGLVEMKALSVQIKNEFIYQSPVA